VRAVTLFPAEPPRPRFVVFSRYDFPRTDEARLYAGCDALAARLAAEHRLVHTVVADPTPLPAALRARCGTGLYAMRWPEQHANDLLHLRRTAPAPLAALLAELGRLRGQDEAAVLARPEVMAAFSAARLVRAYGARAVVAHGLADGAWLAFATARLLALPFVLLLPEPHGDHEYGELLPLYAPHAAAIVVLGADVGAAVAARLGPAAAARLVVAADLAQPAGGGGGRRAPPPPNRAARHVALRRDVSSESSFPRI